MNLTEVHVVQTVWDLFADALSDPMFWATFVVGTFLISFYVRYLRKRRY